jgi:O-antigen/teichoic acid export membrane protein
MRKIYFQLLQSRARQVLGLYVSTILQTVFGFLISIFLARSLGPTQYGNYSYLFNLFNLVLLLVSVGHFVSTSMMLATKKNEMHRENLLGASFIITIVISCAFSAIIFFFSFVQETLFRERLGHEIRILSFLAILLPLQVYLENVYLGLNRIRSLAIQRTLPKLFFLVALAITVCWFKLSYVTATVLLLFTSYVVYIAQVARLKPRFDHLRETMRMISNENRRYGFHVYLGALAGVATNYLASLSISFFRSNMDLGFYNLALSLSMPLMLLPQSVAASYFKDFSDAEKLPDRVIKYTLILSTVSYIAYLGLIKPLVVLFYSRVYISSVPLAAILGLAMIVHGFGDVVNRFLCAKARGKEIRNGAFIVGVTNVVMFLALIPVFGNSGAAIARLVMAVVYFLSMYWYYRKSQSACLGKVLCSIKS